MLVTFEGIDGSGKTTQVRLLKNWLIKKGYQVIATEEPSNNVIGKELKKLMKQESHDWVEAILFAADRALHTQEVITPNKDKIIICDRYTHSALAYQTAMGLKKEWIKCLNKHAPKPDLTIYLDIKPENAIKRIGKSRNKYERLKLLKKVRQNYKRMKSNTFKLLDGEKNIKEVQEMVRKLIKTVL